MFLIYLILKIDKLIKCKKMYALQGFAKIVKSVPTDAK